MDTLECILSRRSIGKVTAEPVAREQIERLLETVVWAPNHRVTEPWRFIVLAGEARAALGEVMAESLRAREPMANEAGLAKERAKPLRAPVVITVLSRAGKDEEETRENEHATAAGIQNMLLAACEMGLGAQWRTGSVVTDPAVREHLGVAEDETIMGFVYVGHPDPEAPRKPAVRQPAIERTEWRGWSE